MRINVYSQELTPEVIHITKESNTGIVYDAAQLILHSSPMLHHPPKDDDRSAVTFWLPTSQERREEIAKAFEKIASIFRYGKDMDELVLVEISVARGFSLGIYKDSIIADLNYILGSDFSEHVFSYYIEKHKSFTARVLASKVDKAYGYISVEKL